MTNLALRIWPDPILSQNAAPVQRIDDLGPLIGDMFDTMYQAKGRGLAAPQIGQLLRLFVMDVAWKQGEPDPVAMINPVIMARTDQVDTVEEGCLSIPDLSVPVSRPVAVTVQWQSETGEFHMDDFDGFAARCIQHEMDHLNGVVTLDHLDAAARRDLIGAEQP